jgi:drug/metabolite transporter (DMT)-like permease
VRGGLQGQSHVSSAQAQVLYSTTPLWSALFAGLLIKGEGLGFVGWAGGLTILAAGYIGKS